MRESTRRQQEAVLRQQEFISGIVAERDRLRKENEELRIALQETLTRLECEWPDARDGPTSSPRTPGLIRDAKEQARAALAKTDGKTED